SRIDLADGVRESARAPPAGQTRGVGPGAEDAAPWRIDRALDDELATVPSGCGVASRLSCGHGISPLPGAPVDSAASPPLSPRARSWVTRSGPALEAQDVSGRILEPRQLHGSGEMCISLPRGLRKVVVMLERDSLALEILHFLLDVLHTPGRRGAFVRAG